ncbi:major facilitator superfamily domain-containing protein [Hygrophoropsis aurantiaca]|uniref:Major facilitator superfamily domain-containing protein n=1 Tax=Hygrophoropsis aurantiaca TaxID=72124 RepID=A0ACB8AER9_9AGAM|nr:major facilitator superfamily domain-containing protein [Hygrophoropsis aurantiaca]
MSSSESQSMSDSRSSTPPLLDAPLLPPNLDPRNWTRLRRLGIAIVMLSLSTLIDMSSTLYSGAQSQIQEQFHVSNFVVTLGVGLINFGFAIGPLIAAPLSELYGRQPVYICSTIGFVAFCLGATLSQSMESLLVCRLMAGLVGAAVFSNYGGTLSDIFTPDERAPLVALFTLVFQGAPTIGPVPSSYMGQYVNWRWILALITIWGAAMTAVIVIIPETEATAIHRKLIKKQMKESGTKDISKSTTPRASVWGKALLTPLIMLFREPIMLWASTYHAFIYGLLFLLLEAYPYVFQNTYGFNQGETGLIFLAPATGNVLGVLVYFFYLKPSYEAKQRAVRTKSATCEELKPEERLPGVMLSSIFTPIGMFWFAFTARSSIHWIVPAMSGVPVGIGMTLLQLSLTNYYIDLYPTRSASALAAACFMRNTAATWFPTFAVPMYQRLGTMNASLILAGISCIGVPSGFVLLIFGSRLRARSKWAIQDEVATDSEMTEKVVSSDSEVSFDPLLLCTFD